MNKIIVFLVCIFMASPVFAGEDKNIVFTMSDLLQMDKGTREYIINQAKKSNAIVEEVPTTREITTVDEEKADVMIEEFQQRTTSVITAVKDLVALFTLALNELLKSPAGFLFALLTSHKMGIFSSMSGTIKDVLGFFIENSKRTQGR